MNSAQALVIRGLSTLSAVGSAVSDWNSALVRPCAPASVAEHLNGRVVFELPPAVQQRLSYLMQEPSFRKLDRTTLLALATVDETLGCIDPQTPIGCISFGSSRGPTNSIEQTFSSFMQDHGRVPALTSPITTAGNISSWVAQRYLSFPNSGEHNTPVATLSTSMTCSSAFHSLLVATSFLRAGMAKACLFGGVESCLTAYTLGQLEALKIYTQSHHAPWPCQPLAVPGTAHASTVTLGEGAGSALLTLADRFSCNGDLELCALGWHLEAIPSATGISIDGQALQGAMRMAQKALGTRKVDAVIAHAPGTRAGDEAELRAIRSVFGTIPVCTTKHLTGHTYGASGMVGLSLASALLNHGARWTGLPYPNLLGPADEVAPPLKTIAINTAGFGGNAITVVVGVPSWG
jgi:3-oxoacyl-[acyl-carrier-protein] synthase II